MPSTPTAGLGGDARAGRLVRPRRPGHRLRDRLPPAAVRRGRGDVTGRGSGAAPPGSQSGTVERFWCPRPDPDPGGHGVAVLRAPTSSRVRIEFDRDAAGRSSPSTSGPGRLRRRPLVASLLGAVGGDVDRPGRRSAGRVRRLGGPRGASNFRDRAICSPTTAPVTSRSSRRNRRWCRARGRRRGRRARRRSSRTCRSRRTRARRWSVARAALGRQGLAVVAAARTVTSSVSTPSAVTFSRTVSWRVGVRHPAAKQGGSGRRRWCRPASPSKESKRPRASAVQPEPTARPARPATGSCRGPRRTRGRDR